MQCIVNAAHFLMWWKCCNLCCLFHRGMVDYTKQICKCCNLHRYFTVAWSTTQNKYGSAVTTQFISPWHGQLHETIYGSAVMYPVYFTVAWSTTQNKYGSAGEFSVFSVVICAWSTT